MLKAPGFVRLPGCKYTLLPKVTGPTEYGWTMTCSPSCLMRVP